MANHSLEDIRTVCEYRGIVLHTNSPGDGIRRFAFTIPDGNGYEEIGRALGAEQAWSWLQGFEAAEALAERERSLADRSLSGRRLRNLGHR